MRCTPLFGLAADKNPRHQVWNLSSSAREFLMNQTSLSALPCPFVFRLNIVTNSSVDGFGAPGHCCCQDSAQTKPSSLRLFETVSPSYRRSGDRMGGILSMVKGIGLHRIEVLDLGAATGLGHRCLNAPRDNEAPLLPNLWSLCLSFCSDLCLASLQAILAASPILQCLYLDHTHPSLLQPSTRGYHERSVTVTSPLISIASLCPRLSVLDISRTSGSDQQGEGGTGKNHRDDIHLGGQGAGARDGEREGAREGEGVGGQRSPLQGLKEVLEAQVIMGPCITNITNVIIFVIPPPQILYGTLYHKYCTVRAGQSRSIQHASLCLN